MPYSVYHRMTLDLSHMLEYHPSSVSPLDYQRVAEVEVENLEEVFSLINTFEMQ